MRNLNYILFDIKCMLLHKEHTAIIYHFISISCDIAGTKRIYAGDFSRGYCLSNRFQPIRFWTNGSMSDCVFAKSICSGDGQLVFNDDSTKEDRSCRCDYKKNYSFIKTPRHLCYCIPTEEDCSCYVRSCPVNQTLSAGI